MLNRKALKPATYERMFTLQVKTPIDEDYQGPRWTRGFGLGFQLMHTPYGLVFAHGGSNGDFKCRFEAYDEKGMGFIVFTNSSMGWQLQEDLREFLITGKRSVGR